MDDIRIVIFYLAVPSILFSILRKIPLWRTKKNREVKGIPGPRQFPVVGRVHDVDRFCMWKKFKEWADIYGPIYRTSMLGQQFIIISDQNIAEELLVKRGHVYSGRPQIRALFDHKTGPGYLALMDRHDIWTRQRKWIHAAMADFHRHHFFGVIEDEVKRYLAILLLDPAKFHANTREHCGRIMSRLAWGDASQGKENADSADCTLTQMSVSGPIVNTMTPLWVIPWALNPWKKFERAREDQQRAWWLNSFQIAKHKFLRGDLSENTWSNRYFVGLQNQGNLDLEQSPEEEEFASCMLGFQNLVGVVTISGPLQFFLMAMLLHPEWQKKAQEEIDRICGDRMPIIDDMADLPTVRACLKETIRWRSGVPLGVPHQAEQNDEFRGERITKGTVILACEWSMNRVPERYPDPEVFHPERYLEKGWPTYQEPLSRYPNFREGAGMHTFGWGRRVCLGQHIVDDEMFVSGAGVLWAFNLVRKTCPKTGEVIEFDSEGTNAHVILEPLPFPCDFQPRSTKRTAQILLGYADIRDQLKI
ncbi:cytochrome P450 [Annulohypoxylon maeteangense]|uniref:cytochrome P450 n=1 Tax=Annulohypoxylon maeteangense TaxID=1927788 RepID=UPI0020078E96|nr:cytochrome P450 [Annulohypoxylon maeteangense]KAI0890123.1 cytochrome P450 [Annulohypoxylon maeteangense]